MNIIYDLMWMAKSNSVVIKYKFFYKMDYKRVDSNHVGVPD